MCVSAVVFRADGSRVRYFGVAELAAAIGGAVIPDADAGSPLLTNECFCRVDMRATAAALGWQCDEPDYGPEMTDHADAWALREPGWDQNCGLCDN